MADARVNGIRLHYEERGEGVPILCIHGTSSSALVWEGALGELARLGRAIAYDRRGSWRSERPEPYERTSASEHADDAAALLEMLDASPAVVIGRSYGGEVATDLALRYPACVRALVLLEGAPVVLSPDAEEWTEAVSRRLIEIADRDGVDAVGQALLTEVAGEDAWRSFPEALRAMFTFNGPAILAELRGGMLRTDRDAVRAIEQPVLLVTASDLAPRSSRGERGDGKRAAGRADRARGRWAPGRPVSARGHRLHPRGARAPVGRGALRVHSDAARRRPRVARATPPPTRGSPRPRRRRMARRDPADHA